MIVHKSFPHFVANIIVGSVDRSSVPNAAIRLFQAA